MKHSPDPPKQNDNEALDLLKQMALEGAKELIRLKHKNTVDVHASVLDEASSSIGDGEIVAKDQSCEHDNPTVSRETMIVANSIRFRSITKRP
jgi:hypothetical protein